MNLNDKPESENQFLPEGADVLESLEEYLNLTEKEIDKQQFIDDLSELIEREALKTPIKFVAANPFTLSRYFSSEKIIQLQEDILRTKTNAHRMKQRIEDNIAFVKKYMDVYNSNPLIFNYLGYYIYTFEHINKKTWTVKEANRVMSFESWIPIYLKNLEEIRNQQKVALDIDSKWIGLYEDLNNLGFNQGETYGDYFRQRAQAKGLSD